MEKVASHLVTPFGLESKTLQNMRPWAPVLVATPLIEPVYHNPANTFSDSNNCQRGSR